MYQFAFTYMSTNRLFEPLDAMEVRTQLGALLDRVEFEQQRFAVLRRGKVKALLVPVADADKINDQVSSEQLDEVYKALDSIKGIVTNPEMQDASSTLDDYLYGELNVGNHEP